MKQLQFLILIFIISMMTSCQENNSSQNEKVILQNTTSKNNEEAEDTTNNHIVSPETVDTTSTINNKVEDSSVVKDTLVKIVVPKVKKKVEKICKESVEPHEPELELDFKPIIYIYPEQTQQVNVRLTYDGKLTHTYPKYDQGWEVTASPDGTLKDKNNKEYYALYWEGKPNKAYTLDKGTIVKGSETVTFLEETLAQMGLNRKEANEFIIYWLPKMEKNNYNLIHFSTNEYQERAQLSITPKPETLIRVMMVYQPLDEKVTIEKQDLSLLKKERKGFTVVEWGGHPLPKKKKVL